MKTLLTLFIFFLFFSPVRLLAQAPAGQNDSCATQSCDALISGDVGSSNAVKLYPNPATSELNVIYDAVADVKNIAVYNIIGKVMSVYKVGGSSANLNLENIPSGIYFVRLLNARGNPVVTRKFTKS